MCLGVHGRAHAPRPWLSSEPGLVLGPVRCSVSMPVSGSPGISETPPESAEPGRRVEGGSDLLGESGWCASRRCMWQRRAWRLER